MKKGIQLILMVLVSLGINAQSLKLYDKAGNDITNGMLEIWGDTSSYNELVAAIEVKNVTNASVDVRVKKAEPKLSCSSEVYFCWDQCYIPAVYVSPTFITIGAGEKNDSSFTGHYMAMGCSVCDIVYYTFYNDKNKNDSAAVRVNYCASPASIFDDITKKASISNPIPNPANGQATFNYNVPNSVSSAKLVLHNMLGALVKEIELSVSGNNHIIKTNNLDAGIYFYSFVIDDKTVSTKRMVVTH